MGREIIGPWLAKKAMIQHMNVRIPVVFDIGAHFGNAAEFYLRMFNKGCNVYCFEPEPLALERLRQRFEENHQVTIHPVALWKRRYSSTKAFYVGGQSGEMSSLLQRPEAGRRYYRHELKQRIRVKVDSVDEFCEEHNIPFIHVMKIDTQGTELDILRGAVNKLVEGAISLIYTEVQFVPLYQGGDNFAEICQFLSGYGYELFDIYNPMRSFVNRRLKVADVLFVSPQVVEKVLNDYPEEWLPKSRDEALGEPSR